MYTGKIVLAVTRKKTMFLLTMAALLLLGPGVHARDVSDVTNDGADVTDMSSLLERMERMEKLLAAQQEREKPARNDNVNWLETMLSEQRVLIQTQSEKLSRLENQHHTLFREQNIKLYEQERRLLRQDQSIQQLTATVRQLQRDAEIPNKPVESKSPSVKDGVSVKGRGAGHSQHTVVQAGRSPNDTVVTSSSHDVVVRSDDPDPLESVVSQLSQQVTDMDADIQALKTQTTSDVQTLRDANSQQDQQIHDAQTSTYVHWGSSQCSGSSQLVYSGVMGGSAHTEPGSATNYLCLTLTPVPIDHAVINTRAYLYGTEFYTLDPHQNRDPVCSVCRSSHSSTIMIPGTNVCTQGWQRQYSGFLMAGFYNDAAGSEFICVDSAMESRPGANENRPGKELTYTFAVCGSLPCEPYVDNKMVSCAVCSL